MQFQSERILGILNRQDSINSGIFKNHRQKRYRAMPIRSVASKIRLFQTVDQHVLVNYINRRFSVGTIIVFQNSSKETMAYYFYINPTINSLGSTDQWQGYYTSFSSLYQTTDDFTSPSLFTLSWPQTDFLKINDSVSTFTPTILSEDGQNIIQKRIVGKQKMKKRTQKTLEKEILSAKKNSQSNIINQFYSFFSSREKSEKILQRCCFLMKKNPEDYEKNLSLFYLAIRLINAKRGRKYVNVAMFLKFFNPEELASYLPEMKEKLEESQILSMEELCQIFRRCSKYFLKTISTSAILTSKRISIVSKQEHLKKRRKFLRTIMEL